ncbi:sugar ABC transporter permease [Paenibacillus sp. MY03]|uniref:ABC transporter permease n=1 Tax=Paenibacillus sp. MY03 TaxID=302980 RepID=UPI000B3CDEA4|nr:ABC transporter permease subunit [Paenibacillus sp. MY03]OUS75580.1 sugar ABC transporter permease [Paenibacillus sp. MY03]
MDKDKQGTIALAERGTGVRRGSKPGRSKTPLWRDMLRSPFLYIIALPGLLLYLVFSYIPMYGIIIAFKKFNIREGIMGSEWVGLSNFTFFLKSGDMGRIVYNTLFLNVLFITATTFFAVLTAMLLNELRSKYYKRVSQSIIFLPFFMSWVVVSMMVNAMLSGRNPTMNVWLEALGLPPVDWMFSPELWPWILTVIRVWQATGYGTIIYLATISSIPGEMYEAARIDGASRRQIMGRITLPMLVPTISILTLLAVGRIFYGDFGMIYALLGDNPILYSTTDVIDTYVFRALRTLNNFGMSAAVGLAQSVMGFVLILTVNMIVRRVSKESSLF